MKLNLHRLLIFILLLVCSRVYAQESGNKQTAQEGSSAVVLEEIVVSEKKDKAEKKEYVPLDGQQFTVTSTDRARTSDTAQLLSDVPGVSLQQNGGVSSIPFLRGLGDDRIRIKVDGMDLISACPNHMNSPLSFIDPTNVSNVSVFAGITPVSLGGDSIAGTIMVNSAAPEFSTPGERILIKGNTGAFYRSNGDAVGANLSATVANEYLSVRYSGSIAQADNYHAAHDFKPAGLAAVDRGWLDGDEVGSSSYKSINHAVALALRHKDHLFELNLGFQHIPYEGFPNQRMDMTDNRSEQINLHYTGQYTWGTLEARVYSETTRHEMDFGDDKQFFYGSAATFFVPGMPMNTKGWSLGALVKADIELSKRNTMRTGIEVQRYRLDDWWPSSPPVLPPGFTTGGMAPNTFWNINNGARDRFDAFAEWEARWNPRWTSLLGVRSDTVVMDTGTVQGYNAMYNGAPLFPATTFNNRDRQRTDYNFDITALARYTPTTTQTYEAGYARKTRSPNLYERYAWSNSAMAMEMINFAGDGNFYIGNIDLKPEVAHTVSVTADWHDAAREQWGLKVTPYYTYVQDFIDARRCIPGVVCNDTAAVRASLTAATGFVYLQFVNQNAHLYGVDVSGYYVLAKTATFGSFTATGVLNYTRGENETTGDDLYNIMPLNAKLAIVHRLGKLTNTVEGQLVDAKTHVSQVRNEIKTDGYGLLNLRSGYEWKFIRVDAGIENVLNTFYALPLGGAYIGQGATMSGNAIPWGIPVPGPARTFYAALSVKF